MRKTNIKTCISTLFVILIAILVINIITNQSFSPKNKTQEDLTIKKIDLHSSIFTLTWTPNGTAICTTNDTQILPKICNDGVGGAIIAWEDERNGTHCDIYAQRIDSNGSIIWTTNGVIICNASYDQWFPSICSDEMGGAIIIWEDLRSGTNWDIYAQKIDSNGNTMWMPNGIAICSAKYNQSYTRICSDGAGGAIITWVDQITDSEYDIYAQRIDYNGNVLWMNNGTAICTERYDQSHPHICNDGLGGAIITWADNRSGIYWTIYAQRIDSGGNIQWTPNGTAICTARYGQYFPQICSDGMGGAIITWYDWGSGTDWDIYAQKINTNGTTQWMDNGTAICTANDLQYWSQICTDGFGGAIITWGDWRSGTNYDIYAQRIDSDGNVKWTTNGEVICNATDQQYFPQLCSDEMGGAIITWYDWRSGTNYDIYAQRIDYNGNVKWTTNGEVICNEINQQYSPQICSDGMGGAIITWYDLRSGTNFDIYAQRIKIISTPTIETMGVNYVMKSEAILIGEINDDGGTDIIEMRFEWGKTYSCSDSWTNNISVSFLSSFYFHLKGLLPNTTYYFRALAKNSEGWSNGSVKSFTTLDSNAYEWYRTSGGDIGYWSNTITFDSLDNMYIAGVKRCYLPFQGTEIFLAKFDNLGREKWIYSWKGKDFDLYFCEAIAVDSFNNIYVAGTVSDSIKEDRNIFLVKFDSSGNEKWNLTWGGGDGEMCSGLAVDSNDNVYVAGTTFSFGAGEGDIFLVKYNGFGVQQWFGTWGGSNEDYCRDLVVDSFDDIILGGNTYSFGVGGSDIWLIKLDNSGVEKWNHTWGGTGWEYCYYLAVDSNSNLYVSGQTSSNKLCLIKFNNSGVEKWNRTWNTSDDYYCSGLAVDSNNDVYVTGDFYNYATGDKNTFLIRYNTLGMQQWNRTGGGVTITATDLQSIHRT